MTIEPYDKPTTGLWKRFLLGSVLIVVAMATATASAVLLEVGHVGSFFKNSTLSSPAASQITAAQAGAPQTFLIIGSDKRALATNLQDRTSPPHSDTLMLVRMDPSQGLTSVMSIPRDLKATIRPDHGLPTTQKINAAYSIGGAALAVQTIKHTLPGITINHIVDINFKGFRRVIDAIGCVYVYVDRRYFHSNAGLSASLQYAEINIQPGYQKLCGQPALDYARYRHGDSDFVRVARQQDFVRQVKQQVGVQHLLSNQDKLFSALQHAVQTDIHGSKEVLDLAQLAAFSLGRPVRQVYFRATSGPSYVTATASDIAASVNDFLGSGSQKVVVVPRFAARRRNRSAPPTAGLNATPASDIGLATGASVGLPFKMYVPRGRIGGTGAPDAVRSYSLRDNAGKLHRAYVVSITRGIAGDYYGIEGTSWMDPPILANPSETRTVGGRTYQLYVDGGHIRVVAWKSGSAVYWVNNTLLASLSNRQMLAIAESSTPVN
ncbi:MAG: LCP family protein [Solirubrobacteraceae bacterium]